jgi:[acyl-carrier-protein] S-malonyltransferase
MIACVFSGQGSQKAGMGVDLCAANPAAQAIYSQAAEILGFDVLSLGEEQLAQTQYAQLAIVTMSLAAWAAFKAKTPEMSTVAYAGFSLGEYSALGAAGVLTLPDLLALVQERARLMQDATDAVAGAMYAVMGLEEKSLLEVVNRPQFAGQVFAVNFNSPGQTVIAGLEDPAAACTEELTAAGARKIRRLNVSGAFHTPLMADAAQRLAAFAAQLTFNAPSAPFYSNAGHQLPADISWPDYLASHMCSPVRWTEEVQQLQADGAVKFLEFGPGKVLTGLIRKIAADLPALPVEDSKTLGEALAAIGGVV